MWRLHGAGAVHVCPSRKQRGERARALPGSNRYGTPALRAAAAPHHSASRHGNRTRARAPPPPTSSATATAAHVACQLGPLRLVRAYTACHARTAVLPCSCASAAAACAAACTDACAGIAAAALGPAANSMHTNCIWRSSCKPTLACHRHCSATGISALVPSVLALQPAHSTGSSHRVTTQAATQPATYPPSPPPCHMCPHMVHSHAIAAAAAAMPLQCRCKHVDNYAVPSQTIVARTHRHAQAVVTPDQPPPPSVRARRLLTTLWLSCQQSAPPTHVGALCCCDRAAATASRARAHVVAASAAQRAWLGCGWASNTSCAVCTCC